MATSDFVGKKMTITTIGGSEYCGVLCRVDELGGKVVLNDVFINGSTKLLGPQYFSVADIQNVKCAPDVTDEMQKENTRPNTSSKMKLRQLRGKKIVQSHLSKLRNLDTDDLATAKCIFSEGKHEDDIVVQDSDSFEDFYQDKDCTQICRICDKFFDAIVYIMEQEVVGVTFQGVDIGRHGTLSLIQIATDTDVIIFDLLRLGEKAFNEGLQEVLESLHVQKVIHDSRWISDLLYHKYNVTLNNVFDTQVANAYVYSLCNGGDWPRYVESLPGCLMCHLGLSHDEVFSDKIRERHQQKDQELWLQRPIPDPLLVFACKNVRHLVKLSRVLLDKMLLVFKVGVKLYLGHSKDAPHGNAEKFRASQHLLPCSFLDIQKYVDFEITNAKEFDYQRKDSHYVTYDQRGFRSNCLGIQDKTVIRSHDSIWHRSESYYSTFRERSAVPGQDQYSASNGMPAEEKCRQKPVTLQVATVESNEGEAKLNSQKLNSHNEFHRARSNVDSKIWTTKSGDDSREGDQEERPSLKTIGECLTNGRGRGHHKSEEWESAHENVSPVRAHHEGGPSISHTSVGEETKSGISPPSANRKLRGMQPQPSSRLSGSKLFQLGMQQSCSNQVNGDGVNNVAPPLSDSDSVSDVTKVSGLNNSNKGNISVTVEQDELSNGFVAESENEQMKNKPQKMNGFGIGRGRQPRNGHPSRKLNFETSSYASSFSPMDFDDGQDSGQDHFVSSAEKRASPGSFGFKSSGTSSASDTDPPGVSERLVRNAERESILLENIAPAGYNSGGKSGKKKMKQLENMYHGASETSGIIARECARLSRKAAPSCEGGIEEDLVLIPHQTSLKRDKLRPLGVSAIGDPCSDDTLVNNRGSSSVEAFIQTQLAMNNEDAIQDSDISDFEQSEKFKNVLEVAKSVSFPSNNLKSRLLPSKVKISPSAGSSKR
ncbi:uncharacterized protein LOC101862633 [Aplysia californica]|uniref:Uncharacterized protein LOC101862633 n=1 Tax=Aplysia californica TaxID=6500 RepID=A0ABM0JGG8_APLCA|nr:uncharacterized protein LOC101862633 [Aplysia californica]